MRMKRLCLASLLAGSLLAGAAFAQEPKKDAAAPAAGAAQDPAARPAPGPGQTPDPQIIEGIMNCLAAGLTPDWKKAWFVIREIDRNQATGARQFQGDFFYAVSEADRKGRRLRTCGAEEIVKGVSDLNDYLTKDQQAWTSARFEFFVDGKYDVKYDYTPFKPKPAAKSSAAKPAAKASGKKTTEAAR
jgi:hypothetical protein